MVQLLQMVRAWISPRPPRGAVRTQAPRGTTVLRIVVAIIVALAAAVPVASVMGRATGKPTMVVVRSSPQAVKRAEHLVEAAGWRVLQQLPIINGFSARVPAGAVALLSSDPAVVAVTVDESLAPMSASYSPSSDMGSMYNLTQLTGAQEMWKKGYTGKGVDVAIIDSGVAPVDGLKGRIINGPDLSFESLSPTRRYLDTYGHGTHLSGIIAGRGSGADAGNYAGDTTNFLGMAPDARIVSVKVADSHGATDVSQVIAAIGWVVQHKNDNGMNIRVLNLSYGTNSVQSAGIDPLSYAAEVAWRKGIVVVAAAGNAGYAQEGSLTNPASDPWILAVGSSDTHGTQGLQDDTVSDFSSSSDWDDVRGHRLVDLVAPGAHVVSLRVPGSYIDQTYGSTGLVTGTLFRGSGTSQAAAVLSGAAALLLQQRPNLKPDEVKRFFASSATDINAEAVSQGNGELNLRTGIAWPDSQVLGYDQANYLAKGTGNGTLEGSRGDYHLRMDGRRLHGEKDIFGDAFDSDAMADLEASGNSWSGGTWNGNSWSGNSWSGNSWSASLWAGNSWSGRSWSSLAWSGNSWSGNSWSGNSWSGVEWTSQGWSGNSWSGNSWSSDEWD